MVILVTGGSASGKSSFAENLICERQITRDLKRFYIATMQAKDEESQLRVEKHRNMRKNKSFITLECDMQIENAVAMMQSEAGPEYEKHVLLECLSNLVANEMFSQAGIDWSLEVSPKDPGFQVVERISSGLDRLIQESDELVIVTNEVFSDGGGYDPMTMQYIEELGRLNQWLARRADQVYEVVFGCPIRLK